MLLVGIAALATAALTGCEVVSTRHTGGAAPAGEVTAGPRHSDEVLLEQVVAALSTAAGLVARVAETQPELAAATQVLGSTHATHLATLRALGQESATPPAATLTPVPKRPGKARALLAETERALVEQLQAAAVEATSGPFARMLSTFAAGTLTAAHSVQVPGTTPPALPSQGTLAEDARDALQDLVASEHAAVAVLAILGARADTKTAPSLRAALGAEWAVHRSRRDALTTLLTASGATPAAADPDYTPPGPSGTPEQVRSTARALLAGLTAGYAGAVARTVGEVRAWAVTTQSAQALAEVDLGADATPLPGAADLATAGH